MGDSGVIPQHRDSSLIPDTSFIAHELKQEEEESRCCKLFDLCNAICEYFADPECFFSCLEAICESCEDCDISVDV